jgi:membrane-associated phospholipid phosphatase
MRRMAEGLGRAWEDTTLAGAEFWRRIAPLRRLIRAQGMRGRRHPLVWGTLYVLLFCPLSMAVLDRPLAWALKTRVHGDIEGFFNTVTNLGRAEFYLVPAALMLLFCLWRARRAVLPERRRFWRELAWKPGFVVLTMALAGILQNLLKVGIGRIRPRLLFEQGLYGFIPFNHHWATNSFPSGHSQAIWSAMGALCLLAPRHRALWVTVALLVAISRIALTVHFLSDVVAGSWLGLAVTLILADRLRRRGVAL